MKKRTVIVSAVSTAIIVIAGITSFSLNKPDVKMAPIEKNTQVISKQGQIKSNGQSNKSESSSTQKDSEKSDNSKNTSGTSSKTENSSTSEVSGSTADTGSKSDDKSSNATVENSDSTKINAKSSSDVEKDSKEAGTFVDGNKDSSVQQELQRRQEEAKKATVQSESKSKDGSVEIYVNGKKI